ncbi:hypothetical protein [Chengkuizengella sediminis]|uniref:hypothetical protein n=1 Tax=Chengkuizengella sediminis TaxID=1885917 RepID=UPI0013898BA6|nr:hypothetical protein [Chengkuizengella sediminis]NDI36647.1 hypothetical protein [Chengkuizengella sediminis]
MRKILSIVFIFVTLFILPMTIYAEGELKTDNKEIEVPDPKTIESPPSIVDTIEPIELERVTAAVEKKGQELYNLLQAGSIPYIVGGLAVSVGLLFLGIFFKKLRTLGIISIVITATGYILINFFPEIINFLLGQFQAFKNSI